MKARKLMYILLGMFVVACTDSNNEEMTENNGEKATIVSLYSEKSCDTEYLLVGDLLVKEGAYQKLNLNVPVHCQNVYMKYTSASGEKITTLALNATNSRAANSEFDMETSRRVSVALSLPEDAVQPTNEEDAGFRFYHNTGVAMFEDDWPRQSTGFDNDFNDVVLEYDLKVTECQNDELLPAQGYKEGLLLTLDVRAKGGRFPTKVGVELLGLDPKFINEVSTRILWKKGQGMADEVATGEKHATINKDGVSFDLKVDLNGNPIILLDGLAGLGDNQNFFQVTEGHIIEGKPMLRAEIKLTGKNRSELPTIEGYDQLGAYRDLILDTKKQNFFIVAKNTNDREIHLKGYQPTRLYTTYDGDCLKGADYSMQNGTTYCNENGYVWAMKVPVGVQHAYESKSFSLAYPKFLKWTESNGAENQDWYLHPDMKYVVRYW